MEVERDKLHLVEKLWGVTAFEIVLFLLFDLILNVPSTIFQL